MEKYRWYRDKILKWIAWHLPKRLVYWAGIRMIEYGTKKGYRTYFTSGNQLLPELTAVIMIREWEGECLI